jgi:hypothetical protein
MLCSQQSLKISLFTCSEEVEMLQRDLGQLSEQYCIKCLENSSLTERIATQTKIIQNLRTQLSDLTLR